MEKESSKVDNLEIIINETENIKNLIYTIRGKQVMLDSDVAMLYHYETKKINQTVKRNIERFPEKFCFQLDESETESLRSQFMISNLEKESESLRSQFVTLNKNGRGQHRKYLPYVFTEQGIAMLSGLLRNEIAIQVSINIIDAFVEMRKFIANNGQIFQEINTIKNRLQEYDIKFDKVFNELQRKEEKEFRQKIFYDGQIWDSYNLIIKLIKKAKEKILIIDNYIDDTILEMLAKKNKNVKVVILTSNKSNISKLDIQKFNKEYPILEIAKTDKFHDRFILIDNKELYHVGASLKDLGKKCFAINKIEDINCIENLKILICK